MAKACVVGKGMVVSKGMAVATSSKEARVQGRR
ncbi:hypothetical protein TorRG33x02_296660 [Trema orientale]|uniref:Uncharacterized protein n=1 Tax=Trema orientale TaxID=63057 RepID=A0A2P5C5L5_TREOI|nr:hypothetical protein TorRG33x02_296660 [Trema orientale]